MPTVFDEKTPKTNKATEPLTPISAIVIVGVTVINKKINITENKASKNWISTLKIFNNKMNWIVNTQYLSIEYRKLIERSLKLYKERTSKYLEKFFKDLNLFNKLTI